MNDLASFLVDDESTLIYGIGNVGRQDDGLGWAFVDRMLELELFNKVDIRKYYQLNIEDAELLSHKERVLFVDASKDDRLEQFVINKAVANFQASFSSHALSIEAVLGLCESLFQKTPISYYLAIKGYSWELQEGLSPRATVNLELALSKFFG